MAAPEQTLDCKSLGKMAGFRERQGKGLLIDDLLGFAQLSPT
ncbi:hypothetical protein [Pseudomonas sp.]|nr:hypothetical protein [Pseudomonas sp.]MDP3816590.1 hypothetical protein [Pseudomonas sp.]